MPPAVSPAPCPPPRRNYGLRRSAWRYQSIDGTDRAHRSSPSPARRTPGVSVEGSLPGRAAASSCCQGTGFRRHRGRHPSACGTELHPHVRGRSDGNLSVFVQGYTAQHGESKGSRKSNTARSSRTARHFALQARVPSAQCIRFSDRAQCAYHVAQRLDGLSGELNGRSRHRARSGRGCCSAPPGCGRTGAAPGRRDGGCRCWSGIHQRTGSRGIAADSAADDVPGLPSREPADLPTTARDAASTASAQ